MTMGKSFFDNGYGVSVICNEYSYGGRDGLFEIAVLKGNAEKCTICYDTPVTGDVIGYLTSEEVDAYVEQIKALPSCLKEEESQ
jgi:hypothetical protein